jgi:tol-pal system protein YbgF
MRRSLRWLAPVAFLATGACFATQEDMQALQKDVVAMRAASNISDSLTQVKLTEVIAALAGVHDSLVLLSGRMSKMQGDVAADLYNMGQQLIAVQELTGQSQARLQELRASLERRNQDLQPVAPPATTPAAAPTAGAAAAPRDTSHAATPTPAPPGPNQLFQLALDQLRRGSAGAARTAFQQLLQQYPTADVAPDAEYFLGEAYALEKNGAAADSAYMTAFTKYPQAPRAPSALYKHALYLESTGKAAAARAAFQQLVQKYPRSDEAALASDHLRGE